MRTLAALSMLISWVGCFSHVAAQKKTPSARPEPVCTSLHPFTFQRGTEVRATVRGSDLAGANGVFFDSAPFSLSVESVETGASPDAKGSKDLVHLRVKAAQDAKPGRYSFRLVTPRGLSNALTIHITDLPVSVEQPSQHDTAAAAEPIAALPSVIAGHLSRYGEADYYSFRAMASQTLTFEAISGLPQIASAGSAATIPNFDPALTIYESGGSWFDTQRLKRIAYNDEPVWVFGRVTDAHLVHQFQRDGTYFLRVEAFAGQGGSDYSYQLKILPGSVPQDIVIGSKGWEERSFVRFLSTDRLNQIAARGDGKRDNPSIETYRASADQVLQFKVPATIEGALTTPGEIHRARFEVTGSNDLAIEVETPNAAPPFFNPVVRLLTPSGEEFATNLFAGRGACNGALTKSLQAKTIVSLRESGVYTLEVRDATADLAGHDFKYRIQVRPQIPHLGRVNIDIDHVNLTPDEAKTIRVVFDREEDYRGAVAVSAESLPAGVQAVTGADFEPDKDPPPAPGKRERYTPRSERTVLVLAALPDAAPMSQPQVAKIVVRPVVNGKMGEIIATKLLPIMVIAKP